MSKRSLIVGDVDGGSEGLASGIEGGNSSELDVLDDGTIEEAECAVAAEVSKEALKNPVQNKPSAMLAVKMRAS